MNESADFRVDPRALRSIMAPSPQAWNVDSVIGHGFGEVIHCDTRCACLRLGPFHLIEGVPEDAVIERIRRQMSLPACVISSDTSWYKALSERNDARAVVFTRRMYRQGGLNITIPASPGNIRVEAMTDEDVEQLRKLPWAEDVFDAFASTADFLDRGFGFVAKDGQHPVSLCCSFSVSDFGVEIEVDTAPEQQGRGLARLVCSQFLQECRNRGTNALWDATSDLSARLAERLGLKLVNSYEALELVDL